MMLTWLSGQLDAQSATLPDYELVVAGRLEVRDAVWRPWLEHSMLAVADVIGHFPESRLRIVLHEGRSEDPVDFGWVQRGLPVQVHFRVRPDARLDELKDDWHGYHEFAHLLLPFSGNRDIWFAEGLASYYQYFLPARSGVIDTDRAWARLQAGFQRGLDDPAGRGRRLASLSPDMWSERAQRRVYWTGAAFFLRVDTALRRASSGEWSLDRALAEFNRCCRSDRRRWTATQLIDGLGRLSLPEVWQAELETSLSGPAEPQFGPAGSFLGLTIESGRIRLDPDPIKHQRRSDLALGVISQ